MTQADSERMGEYFTRWMRESGRLGTVTREEAADMAEVFSYGFMYGMVHGTAKLYEAGDPFARAALLRTAGIEVRKRGEEGQ